MDYPSFNRHMRMPARRRAVQVGKVFRGMLYNTARDVYDTFNNYAFPGYLGYKGYKVYNQIRRAPAVRKYFGQPEHDIYSGNIKGHRLHFRKRKFYRRR